MKVLKLPQPYAQMVISGALQTIPNIWGNIQNRECIIIYAEDIANDIKDGIDFSNKLHRKVSNELFLGNINEMLETCAFLGYVNVAQLGELTQGWPINHKRTLFVNNPHEFINQMNYPSSKVSDAVAIRELIKNGTIIPSKLRKANRIYRQGNKLIVPIGDYICNRLKSEEYWDVLLFYEPYMSSTIPSLMNYEDYDEIEDVVFLHNGKPISVFRTYDEVYVAFDVFKNSDGDTNTFEFVDFGLEADNPWHKPIMRSLYARNPKISNFNNRHLNKEQFENEGTEDDENYYGRHPYIRIISTPMGGMTKYKRR